MPLRVELLHTMLTLLQIRTSNYQTFSIYSIIKIALYNDKFLLELKNQSVDHKFEKESLKIFVKMAHANKSFYWKISL